MEQKIIISLLLLTYLSNVRSHECEGDEHESHKTGKFLLPVHGQESTGKVIVAPYGQESTGKVIESHHGQDPTGKVIVAPYGQESTGKVIESHHGQDPTGKVIVSPYGQDSTGDIDFAASHGQDSAIWNNANERIVGGTPLTEHSWPFLVSIGFEYMDKVYHICGGSVLDSLHILSAAHCFQYEKLKYVVSAGKHRIGVNESSQQIIAVSGISKHPNYTGSYGYDTAVLRLSRNLTLDGHTVKAVDLNADGSFPETGATCSVAGWGRTYTGGPGSPVPLKVDLAVQDKTFCASLYAPAYNDDQICAGGEKDKSGCSGDSGGPLVCQKGGLVTQVGVVSYGTRVCAMEGYPNVFARVSYVLPWIKQTAELP